MLVVGLTGGIGSGKSVVAGYFESLAIPVIDADRIAHSLLEVGKPAFDAIVTRYGDTILTPQGTIDRVKLRHQALFEPQEKAWLEGLLHPLIRLEIKTQLRHVTLSTPAPPYVVIMAPLLVETTLHTLTDRLLVIDCPETCQVERACHRDPSLSPHQVKAIISLQAPRAVRCQKADDIIENTSTRQELYQRVVDCHMRYLKLAGLFHGNTCRGPETT